jgi:uncharacterized protein YgbK (DUF1537 family)
MELLIDDESIGAVLFDALDDSHLARIGELIWRRALREPLLAVGASSVAQASVAHWRRIGWAPEICAEAPVAPAHGPVFVLVGSQSPVSRQQAEAALGADGHYEAVRLDPSRAGDVLGVETVAATCAHLLQQGRSVLAFTGPIRDDGPSRIDMARACGRLLQLVLERAPMVRRVGIAGGDTSSLSIEALGVWALGFVGALSPGVSLTRVHADDRRLDGLELMLKGGQMGPVDVFTRLLRGTG